MATESRRVEAVAEINAHVQLQVLTYCRAFSEDSIRSSHYTAFVKKKKKTATMKPSLDSFSSKLMTSDSATWWSQRNTNPSQEINSFYVC